MENLEQYCVVADYHRKDSHQVNLSAGQVVHVIEKHDTGQRSKFTVLCVLLLTVIIAYFINLYIAWGECPINVLYNYIVCYCRLRMHDCL